MKNHELDYVGRLAGTDKSTNSYLLFMQLERAGKTVKWIHEVNGII